MDKIKKVINTIVGALLVLPNLLAAIGVIQGDAVAGLVENIGVIGAALTSLVTAVGGIILIFTGGEPLSVKNIV
jgi:hypothetical protein